MKIALVVLLFVCIAAAVRPNFKGTPDQQFEQFKQVFGRKYKSQAEEKLRFKIFADGIETAKKMTEESKGATQYGVTQFSDLTPEEFKHLYLMKEVPEYQTVPGHELEVNTTKDIPSFWDWRYVTVGTPAWAGSCVSAVYNQGQCGSCWAFSATEQIESMFCLQGHSGGVADHFSMQQIVSCDTSCYGCNGGWTYLAYEYVISAGGIDSYSSYPYTCQTGTCQFNPNAVQAKLGSWSYVGQNNEATMLSYITSTGPLSICVDAETWQYYQGGVVLGSSCGTSVDHCVQITGYNGNFQGYQAWIVRNSWGTSWGYSGYLYVQYGVNACCLASTPTTVQTI